METKIEKRKSVYNILRDAIVPFAERKNMKLLIVTNSCSEKKYKHVCKIRNKTIIDPQQKFFRLCIDGIGKIKKCDTEVLSALPVSSSTVNKYIFKYQKEVTKDGVKYNYLPFLNGKFMRYISLILATRHYTKKWCKQNAKNEAIMIVDPLIPVIAIPSRRIAQKSGIKVAAIVTDLPTLSTEMKERKESRFKEKCLSVYQKIADLDLRSYDYYIPLTESINDEINVLNKPHYVIEGFADSQDEKIFTTHDDYIMYAGGIYEKYGVKALVDAFLKLKRDDIELYIFGEGTYTEELKKISEKNPRVRYMGCVTPEKVVEYEKRALLLVNPRPTDEKFAKYSFPSKTMEYLLSGTAVASTRLPGIPKEYFNYMYALDGFTEDKLRKSLDEILSQSKETLGKMGKKGHEFVLKEKNNQVMAQKIYDFLMSDYYDTKNI